MKKVILVTLLAIGFSALAQQREGRHQGHEMNNLSPEQMATLQTKQMTLALDLNAKQQGDIQKLNLERATARKAKMEAHKALKESADAAKPTSEQRYAMQNERLDQQIAHKAAMKKILTQEQYEKWGKMDHRKGKHRKGMKGKKSEGRKLHKEKGN
tara:strand:- start:2902 stop:3369 length:468 start_codon:yes stop_codon:yes gene_type:complete